jgi:hypothetical protein
MEVHPFLRAVQWHVRGVDVDHQFLRCTRLRSNELLGEDAVESSGMRPV